MDTPTKVAVVATAVAVAIIVGLVAVYSLTIHGSGRIVTFNIEADIESIDWGVIQNGTSKQVSFNVTSTSSIAGTLSMTHDYPDFLTLTWDSEGVVLGPSYPSRTVTFILTAAPNAEPQTFSGDITITLTGGE